jgi:hypothetical protein
MIAFTFSAFHELSCYPGIVLGIIILGLAIVAYTLYDLFFHPLSGIPGPIGARTGLWSWKSTRAARKDMVFPPHLMYVLSLLKSTGLEITRAA